jgi:hypothetical protein
VGQTGEKPCVWIFGTLMAFAAESWNWNISSVSTALIFAY